MKICPAKKQIVVKPTTLKSYDSTVITVVETEKKKPEVGEVIEIGKGVLPVPVKVGDVVAYRAYAGATFYFGGQETIFVHFDDILGVIKK